jgi:hypothetical protein
LLGVLDIAGIWVLGQILMRPGVAVPSDGSAGEARRHKRG